MLLLHADSGTVVGLNEAAASLWEALRWPQSADDLAQLLVAAWPERSLDWARGEVEAALRPLVEHAFVIRLE